MKKKKKKKNVEECKEEEGVFSKLPNDITTNILLKLPFKSVGRGRCVCKLWYNILSDTYFLKAQLTQLSKISPDIFLFTRASLVTQQFLYIEVSEEAFKSNPIMPFKVIDYDFISEAFHLLPRILGCCNGFVCISGIKLLQTELPCYPIYVFNPITEEYSDLPQCDDPYLEELECGEERDVCLSGFGFDDSIMEFKLVIVMFVELGSKSGIYENIVQVHTLGSTIWRRMNGVVPDVLRSSQ
ncbi:hypothetical protein IFM89_017222 [Coptis chinensis]|uniref:F-box domain-containing protein n=1 Tax=Coptis chinensis TaxID=261450 RepID=A0A835I5J6_9MAGN|nr:hypothetical protein IFM89_017222 [Coptis chinensis]